MEKLFFDKDGLLPHMFFEPQGITLFNSPYEITWEEFKELFQTNDYRLGLAEGLLNLYAELKDNNIDIARVYIGGSYISAKAKPEDLDILISWYPHIRLNNRHEAESYIAERSLLFSKSRILQKYNIQVHFHGLIGSMDNAVNTISKWIMLNSYSREHKRHRGIVSLIGNSLAE